MKVAVSMDKVMLEFEGVRLSDFLPWCIRLTTQYRTKHIKYKKLYCYQMHIRLNKGGYLHVYYKNFREVASYKGYTLRIEKESYISSSGFCCDCSNWRSGK
jgi:hypothetical protein